MTTAIPLRSADTLERVEAYREARRKGVGWLLRQLNRDGSIGDPGTRFSYHRAPWTFSVVGETEAATANSAWIRRHLVTPEDRIDGPYRILNEWATYRDATLVVGASLAIYVGEVISAVGPRGTDDEVGWVPSTCHAMQVFHRVRSRGGGQGRQRTSSRGRDGNEPDARRRLGDALRPRVLPTASGDLP